MKKTISLVLALLMCAMLIPASAFAANEPLKTVTVQKTNIKADRVTNEHGMGSLQTITSNEIIYDDWGFTEETITSRGLIDSNGKEIIPMSDNDGLQCGPIVYSNGVFVDTTTCRDEFWNLDIFTYNDQGKKIGGLKKCLDEYAKKAYGADYSCAIVDGAEAAGDYISATASFVDDSWTMMDTVKVVIDPAAGKVLFKTHTVNEDEVGLAYATWYNTRGGSEGLIQYRSYKDEPSGEYLTEKILDLSFKDTNGKTVIDLTNRYVDAYPFKNGLAAVADYDGVGFIDKNGKEVIPCKYYVVRNFMDGKYAAVRDVWDYGYIDKTGKTVIPFEYDGAYGSGDDIFTVAKNDKYGAVDINNTVVVPFEYDDITQPEGGVMYAIKDGTVYVIKYADNAAATTQPETPAATDVKEKFGDVPATAWYGPFLQKAFDNGIVGGMSADKFGPDSNLTNAQIMVMVANLHAMQKGEKIDLAALSDGTHWASAFRNYCKAEGIIDSRFDSKMDAKVNRGEMAYYFANAISAKSYADKNEANFSDVNGNAYAAEITKLAKAGIVGGFSDGTFKADQLVTRAQSCVFVSNLIDAMGK